jgi:hypothetical protein
MSTLPTTKRFYAEDYKESPEWFKRFLAQLNLYTDPVASSLNNGLTFQQNFNSQLYSLSITGNSDFTKNTASFTCTINGTPDGVMLIQASLASNIQTALISPINFSWYFNGGLIFITGISGLTPTVAYKLNFLVF